jgi:hypothetical protein
VEWTENEATQELLNLVKHELKQIVMTPMVDCLVNGEPSKSHENLVELDARAHSFATFQIALEGDWSYFEELDDE